MSKILFYFLGVFSFPLYAFPLKVVHYNIKELDSEKIRSGHSQILHVKNLLKNQEFDFLSINEIQYDLPGVPNQHFQSNGENLRRLASFLDKGDPFSPHHLSRWHQSFHEANTGKFSRPCTDGTYCKDRPRQSADPINFGMFPGQYSTGALSRFPIESEKIITDLPWKVFHPQRDLAPFRDANLQSLPENVPLFDKNFSHLVVNLHRKKLHFILLHTVPAFGFGQASTPNFARNEDQLRFLEWYLTGETDINVDNQALKDFGITPLRKGDLFVAMGDWNTDISSDENPGSAVLRRLFSKVNLWMEGPTHTFENPSFNPAEFSALLDYIVTSKNVKVISGKTLRPDTQRERIGCWEGRPGLNEIEPHLISVEVDRKIVSYYVKDQGKTCYDRINKDYYDAKMASDHFPIWAELEISI